MRARSRQVGNDALLHTFSRGEDEMRRHRFCSFSGVGNSTAIAPISDLRAMLAQVQVESGPGHPLAD